ncbi:hypothetical protein DMW62_21710 [Serratia marcescens]|uniref:Uncharacterized protein n=1 Tax=Serratia marcescens TaxID=615 RepID=A0ABX5N819_SERMA|nr:hypothetical protein DMW40_21235 [Serratia marcescens]PYA32334.1 hypothetical protein DMW50_21565 [Serratia marcescens]PYA35615.1 hypothetical protein DMW47_21360 [Serratia marcescens]PYA36547.1 hypothetical protein DMW44_19445 [Serratia marcescens]PYA59174.1 hypothetical protein DMW51_21675 [Serratia marcescens]
MPSPGAAFFCPAFLTTALMMLVGWRTTSDNAYRGKGLGWGNLSEVKGVERHSKNPVKQDFIDFIKTKLHTFLYTLVFAWASALTSFLSQWP